MGKYYIENRVWYVGYTWINFDSKNISDFGSEYASEFSAFNKRAFAHNNYSGDEGEDLLYVSYTADRLNEKFQNPHYDASETHLEFKFLTNGCVNIILTMVSIDPDNFAERVKNVDEEGAGYFVASSDDIINLLHDLLQNLVNHKILECNKSSLWGIPSLLSKVPLNLKELKEFGIDPDKMYGRKTLYWSVLYVQHVISNDDKDYQKFTGIKGEIELHAALINPNCSEILKAAIGNGKFYWHGGFNECDDVKYFLEVEAVLLSKNVIVTTSIDFNTELSLILLKNSALASKASIDDLRKPNALIRTHLACTEMFIPSFSEEALIFYEKYDELEGKMIKERVRLQKESEETLLQIANTTELSKNQTKAEWVEFFLAAISAMTIFSVLQDATSFVLVDETPGPENYRLSLVLIITLAVVWLIRGLIPSKK